MTETRFVRKCTLIGEDVENKDCFNFDKLNSHQTFVEEFEDSFNSEGLDTLGGSRPTQLKRRCQMSTRSG